MPCGCFGGGAGVGKKDGDKYGPKGKANDESKVQLITTKPPVIEPIPEPKKAAVQTSAAPGPPPKGGSSPTESTRREDDPDKANRRRDVVASYYSDECELLTYKNTSSRPTSQVDDGEASPPAATSSPVPSSPGSSRSAASTRADLAEKRREFFKPLVEDTKEPPWTGNTLRQPLIGHDLAHPHAQPLLEKHERVLENFKEPTVKDVVHKFEHMPEEVSPSKLETEVVLGKNSSTTVTVLHSKEMRIAQKPVNIITHKDEVKLTPEQEIQEKQLVNKASVHQQLLGGQANLRHAPAPKPKQFPEVPMPPPVTVTVPDQAHNDDCIVPAKPPREPNLSEARNVAEPAPVVTEPESIKPKSVVEEPKSVVEEPKSVVEEPKSVVEEPRAVVEEPRAVVEEPRAVVEEPRAVVEEPRAVVEESRTVVEEPKSIVEPISIVEESQFVAESQSLVKDVKPIVDTEDSVIEPEPSIAGHKSENIVELEHVQQSIESVEKREPFTESEKLSGSEPDITNTKLSDTFEVKSTDDGTMHTQTTKSVETDEDGNVITHTRTIKTTTISTSDPVDLKDLTSVNEPTFAAGDISFVNQETDLITVLEENKKNILSSQPEQITDDQPKNTTERINSDQSFNIESKSINNENQEMFSQIENSMGDSPHVKSDNSAASEEERISINSKEGPMALDMAKELLADISDGKHSVEVKTTDDGTMHTQTTKSVETDEDGNVIMHTRTIKTTTIGSSEPMSEMMEDLADNWSKPIMDVQSSDDGTLHTQTTKSTVTDEDGNTITHTRTIKSTTISSSDPMSEILSTEAFMTETPGDTTSAFISESSSVVADKSSDIQSTLQSSLSPINQVGSSPTPSSTPSPRNSIHSSPTSPCASSPSPPASPDSSRAQKMDKDELQHEKEPLVPSLKQDTQESLPIIAQDQLSQEEKSTHNTVINKDAKTNGPPSPSITAPTSHSQEDDGLGSEIDDALDSDLLNEETNGHSNQHHHQSVPAPPPPSSAS